MLNRGLHIERKHMDDDPHVLRFLGHTLKNCAIHGVAVLLANKQYFFLDGKKVSAYFVSPRPESPRGKIAIALLCDGRNWVFQLVHESGHFEQWCEQSELWQTNEFNFSQATIVSGSFDDGALEKMLQLLISKRALELDCERRAVRIITEWCLPVDIDAYIQYANMHIWSYTLELEQLRRGNPIKPVRFRAHLVTRCPKEFLDSYDDVPNFLRESARRR